MAGIRFKAKKIACRKRDIVIRLSDWSKIRNGTGGYDVEVYVQGIYRPELSDNYDKRIDAIARIHTVLNEI